MLLTSPDPPPSPCASSSDAFLPATQRASVREDSPAGAVVLRMNASDDDAQGEGGGSGLVRSISYSSCEKIVLTDLFNT